tara:strand:+ start:18 stop:284 length:267 start_codon:yes stop_codon:yes gene_type:complete
MDKRTEILDAQEAEQILKSHVFKKAFTDYKNQLIQNWENTPLDEPETRENIYRAIKILPEIERQLRIAVEKGKISSKDLRSFNDVFKK